MGTPMSIDLEMCSRGGLDVLDAIEIRRLRYASPSPPIGKGKQAPDARPRARYDILVAKDPFEPATAQPESADAVAKSYEEWPRIAARISQQFYDAFFLLPKKRRWPGRALRIHAPARTT